MGAEQSHHEADDGQRLATLAKGYGVTYLKIFPELFVRTRHPHNRKGPIPSRLEIATYVLAALDVWWMDHFA